MICRAYQWRRSEIGRHTSELQSPDHLVCRLLLEKKKAYQLVQEGYSPVIFEADDRIGGMTAAFDFNGLTIERYYHFHCISDHAFLQTLDELGLADKMHWVET